MSEIINGRLGSYGKQFDELGFKGLINRDSCIMSGITPGITVHYCEMSDSIA